jgi:outer membrane protein OmpA-like peptidoglycan-associated protein
MRRAERAAVFLLALTGGCTQGPLLSGRIRGLSTTVEDAERNGAMACAPRELAIAKSQLEFARIALEQGRASAAEEHLAKAEPNARAAFTLSPPDRCVFGGELARTPPDSDGDGIDDSRDQCILEPEDRDGYLDDDGCPDLDDDADGIPDEADQCKNEPEDFDGFQDGDGCPDPDNDGDGVADVDDFCPNTPGIAGGDHPGCPKKSLIVVTEREIRITQQIQFEFNKAVIKPGVSTKVLDEVVTVLNENPKITLEVQGHTDNVGGDAYNLRLSQARADAVRTYLVVHGIAGSRLLARGYGMRQPIAPNISEENRAQNRRVQFIRTELPNR